MAGLPCTICGTESAVFMLTSMETGDTESVGQACAPSFALGFAASMSDGMTLEQSEAYGELFDQIAAHDQRPRSGAATGVASGRRRGKSAPVSETSEPAPPDDAQQACNVCGEPLEPSSTHLHFGTAMAPPDGDFPGALTLPLDDVAE